MEFSRIGHLGSPSKDDAMKGGYLGEEVKIILVPPLPVTDWWRFAVK